MCSIIGYRGKNSAAPILVNGLQRMEYRGYDSVGIATKSKNQILLRKGVGKVVEVNNAMQLDGLPGNIGIGHTRCCLLYTSPSPRDKRQSRMPSSA